MTLTMYERIGHEGRRPSPFSWRIRYALAHKGLEPQFRHVRFSDVETIRALSGQHFVPIITDGDRVIHDSWNLACYLEARFPDRPRCLAAAASARWRGSSITGRPDAQRGGPPTNRGRFRLLPRCRGPRLLPPFARGRLRLHARRILRRSAALARRIRRCNRTARKDTGGAAFHLRRFARLCRLYRVLDLSVCPARLRRRVPQRWHGAASLARRAGASLRRPRRPLPGLPGALLVRKLRSRRQSRRYRRCGR